MRRVIVAVIAGGFAFGGIGTGLGQQSGILGVSLTGEASPAITSPAITSHAITSRVITNPAITNPAITSARLDPAARAGQALSGRASKASDKASDKASEKTVTYDGLEVSVPASWPVYWLNQDPNQCVRYDRNAVYIGAPGVNQACPAGLIGRDDTISIAGPAAGSASLKTDRQTLIEGKPVAAPALTPGTIVQDASLHEFAVTMPAASPSVDATYGTDPALVKQALATIRQVKPQSTPLVRPKPRPTPKRTPKPRPTPRPKPTPKRTPKPRPTPRPKPTPKRTPTPKPTPKPTPTRTPTPKPKPTRTHTPTPKPTPTHTPTPTAPVLGQAGFDTCTAPSLTAMQAWRAKYSVTAIYIGGQMMACDYGNLSASWIGQAEAMGWSLMPLFVGLQAPCDSFSGEINPHQAAAEGFAAASQAVANAASFGLQTGTPIYYDMEGYDHTNAGCRTAVLAFLDAWDRQLTAMSYVSGVYSSADSAITDLQSTNEIAGHALAQPQAIWLALWDNSTNLSGSPYLNASVWPVADRSKQYAGNQNVSVGGISLNIDEDWVDSAVAAGLPELTHPHRMNSVRDHWPVLLS
jgi:outer membrane biosynthesis protein TonB